MTFYRLAVSAASLLMLFLLGGVLSVQFLDSKTYVEEQLYLNAQNSAASLSLSMTTARGDIPEMKTMINAVFDNGYYEFIELLDKDRKSLYIKNQPPQMGGVPQWFADTIKIDPLYAEAQISSGWNPIGYVRVKSDRGVAYRQMYRIFKNTIITFVIFSLIGFLLLHILMRLALTSLDTIQKQAEGIMQNRFMVEKRVSPILEFRRISEAMNKMVKHVKEIFLKNEQIVQKNREILYKDELTGLYNRRFFLLKLSEFLNSEDSRSEGSLVILQIKGIGEANRKRGYPNSDRFLIAFARALQTCCEHPMEAVVGRINAVEFSLLLPSTLIREVHTVAGKIRDRFEGLAQRFELEEYLSLHMGVSGYRSGRRVSSVLARLDHLLAEAAVEESGVALDSTENGAREMGRDEWRQIIVSALKEGSLIPVHLPVVKSKNGKPFCTTVVFDLEWGGVLYRYGEYAPMSMLLGLESDLMESVFKWVSRSETHLPLAVEIFGSVLKESEKYLLFEKMIFETAKRLSSPLIIEIPQKDIETMDDYFLKNLSERFESHGVRVAVSRAGTDVESHRYLEHLKPLYLKMHISLFVDMDISSKNAFYMMLKSLGIELVITGKEEELKQFEPDDSLLIMSVRDKLWRSTPS